MIKLGQLLTNLRTRQELVLSKIHSIPNILYLIIVLLLGEIFYLVNELNQSKSDYAQLRTITDDLSLQVEKLKQVDISVTEETPPSNIPWKTIGVISSIIAAVLLFKYFGGIDPTPVVGGGTDPTPVVESINSLRTMLLPCMDHPREKANAFDSWGLFTRLNSLQRRLESIDKHLGPLDDKLEDISHQVAFLYEENKNASKVFIEAV